ncbi:MAG: hypothetical protein E7646_06865 [Ruminococcaceae bacterium]|nr:hypothetical protein [Oscillospiraceae bacterium]
MERLPKGYYAVIADEEKFDGNSFNFKGTDYQVTKGENLFFTLKDANDAAKDIPEVLIDGVPEIELNAPVILMSAGEHPVGRTHKNIVKFLASRIILGQRAGISPNLKPADPRELPEQNPLRGGDNETIFRGGYDFGNVYLDGEGVTSFYIDGVTLKKSRFACYTSNVTHDSKYHFKNLIHQSPSGHSFYVFAKPISAEGTVRELLFENIRQDKDFFDCRYGANLFDLCSDKVTIDGLVVNGTTQVFGFCSIPRQYCHCAKTQKQSSYVIKNSYVSELRAENGIFFGRSTESDKDIVIKLESSCFKNASREGESPINPFLYSDNSSFSADNCIFEDTRGNACAISIGGSTKNVSLKNCSFYGFEKQWEQEKEPPKKGPDYIENKAEDWISSDCDDPHRIIGTDNHDFSELDQYYQNTKPYRGDLHCHSACGGTSDGNFPLEQYAERMDKISMDFAVIVDHRQMRGFFLPCWDDTRFIIGTEPGTYFTDLKNPICATFHYNMLFPHKYGLAMVLANFPEFGFKGDELTGKFGYPSFTKERFYELCEYVNSIGGIMVHAHPAILMASEDPEDYYLGENSFIETLIWGYGSHGAMRSYDLWTKLLSMSKHVYASSGSDSHSDPANRAPATFYLSKKDSATFFEKMKKGDFAPGALGIKMTVGGHPMGSRIAYREGMRLCLRVDDFYAPAFNENTTYEITVITDKGVAYRGCFDGSLPQALEMEVQKRAFYRVLVRDITHNYIMSISNPVWLDKDEE